MTLLDRYILRTILASVGLVMAVLLTLDALFVFIEQQDDIGIGSYTGGAALVFVVLNLPQQFFEVLPVGALLGSLVGLGGLARGSELTVMRASGISIARIAGSALIAGVVLLALAVLVGEFLAPPLREVARERKAFDKFSNVSFAGSGGAWVRDGDLIINVQRQSGEGEFGGMTLFELSFDHRLLAVGRAASASGDASRVWRLRNYAESRFTPDRIIAGTVTQRALSSNLSAAFLGLAVADPTELATRKLYDLIRHLQANALDTRAQVFALWSRIARTVSVVFTCLLAIPFVFGAMRTAGTGMRTMLGIFIGVGYYLLQRVVDSSTFVFQLNPVLLAWLPTALLAAITVTLIARTR
ncbi:MAG TPA: LPS export ABC transporter permease LptG [Steroidobacteraceae bacterium]